MAEASNVIAVKGLTKRYARVTAVDSIDFTVQRGEVFAILGENGAGKTTTLEMIEGLRTPTAGAITVLGHDAGLARNRRLIKRQMGVQLQSSAYYQYLTLAEILTLFGHFYPKAVPAGELLTLVNLTEKARSLVRQISGGQQQRFSIAAALVNDPAIIFLDEPTTGLDPNARRAVWELIGQIKRQGKTIVLTTHYMEEAELLADRVAIMDAGKIIALDRTHRLIDKLPWPYTIRFHAALKPAAQKKLEDIGQLQTRGGKEDYFELRLKRHGDIHPALAALAKLEPESLTVGRATLEDVFVTLTGKTL